MNATTTGLAPLLALCFLAIRNDAAQSGSDAPATAQSTFEDLQSGWRSEFTTRGEKYVDARMALYREHIVSACGNLLAPGAYYCPLDRTLYLDFAAGGMQLHVIAHELGHHVQSLRGITSGSSQLELHADCLAGVGFRLVDTTNEPTLADIENTLQALHADSARTHGTVAERLTALHRGQTSRSSLACDDFATRQ